MVPSLEYIARNAVYENTFHFMRSKKKKCFIISGEKENLDQCKQLAKSMTMVKTHRISLNSILVILNS
jgi:hypothetical protein